MEDNNKIIGGITVKDKLVGNSCSSYCYVTNHSKLSDIKQQLFNIVFSHASGGQQGSHRWFFSPWVLVHWPSDGGGISKAFSCLSDNTVRWLDFIWGCRPEHLLMASLCSSCFLTAWWLASKSQYLKSYITFFYDLALEFTNNPTSLCSLKASHWNILCSK